MCMRLFSDWGKGRELKKKPLKYHLCVTCCDVAAQGSLCKQDCGCNCFVSFSINSGIFQCTYTSESLYSISQFFSGNILSWGFPWSTFSIMFSFSEMLFIIVYFKWVNRRQTEYWQQSGLGSKPKGKVGTYRLTVVRLRLTYTWKESHV